MKVHNTRQKMNEMFVVIVSTYELEYPKRFDDQFHVVVEPSLINHCRFKRI